MRPESPFGRRRRVGVVVLAAATSARGRGSRGGLLLDRAQSATTPSCRCADGGERRQVAAAARRGAATGSRSSTTRAKGRRRRAGASARPLRADSTGPVPATLHVGDAIVRLNAAASRVGPSLEASPSQLRSGRRATSVAPLRIRVINRGDEPSASTASVVTGRNAASSRCSRPRARAGGSEAERCETLVAAAIARRRAARRAHGSPLELPQAPYAVSMRTVADAEPAAATDVPVRDSPPAVEQRTGPWSFGIVSARFVNRW